MDNQVVQHVTNSTMKNDGSVRGAIVKANKYPRIKCKINNGDKDRHYCYMHTNDIKKVEATLKNVILDTEIIKNISE